MKFNYSSKKNLLFFFSVTLSITIGSSLPATAGSVQGGYQYGASASIYSGLQATTTAALMPSMAERASIRQNLPPTIMHSYVRESGSRAEQIYGDEGTSGPPPLSDFKSIDSGMNDLTFEAAPAYLGLAGAIIAGKRFDASGSDYSFDYSFDYSSGSFPNGANYRSQPLEFAWRTLGQAIPSSAMNSQSNQEPAGVQMFLNGNR